MWLPLLRTIALRVLLWWAMNVESEREHTKHIPSTCRIYIDYMWKVFSLSLAKCSCPAAFFSSGYSFHHPIYWGELRGRLFCDINFINLCRSSIHPRAVKSGSSGFNEGEIGEEHAAEEKKSKNAPPYSAYWFFNLYTLWSEKNLMFHQIFILMTRRRRRSSSPRYATQKLCKFGSSMSILFFIEDIYCLK